MPYHHKGCGLNLPDYMRYSTTDSHLPNNKQFNKLPISLHFKLEDLFCSKELQMTAQWQKEKNNLRKGQVLEIHMKYKVYPILWAHIKTHQENHNKKKEWNHQCSCLNDLPQVLLVTKCWNIYKGPKGTSLKQESCHLSQYILRLLYCVNHSIYQIWLA